MRLAALVALTLVFPAAAGADGLPVIGVDVGPEGVALPGEPPRYVALPVGKNTLVARIDRGSGKVRASRVVDGRLTIPAVAYDGSAAGLSADGQTLVLIVPRPAFPRASTTFAVMDTGPLALRSIVRLKGDFSFDAMSPDGRWLYLIQYTSPKDPLQYRVRVLSSVTGLLHPKPIVDPREPGEAMNGHPLTRATSPDGRWAYTLYEGTEHPFVHALDTTGRSARCIDLDWLHGRKDLWAMRFSMSDGGRELSVRAGGKTVALVDTRTFAATTGVEADDDGRSPWVFFAFGIGLLLAASAGLYVVGSRRRAASTSFGGATSA
jgi:DNA-binding beta-propeller fold protein YncE